MFTSTKQFEQSYAWMGKTNYGQILSTLISVQGVRILLFVKDIAKVAHQLTPVCKVLEHKGLLGQAIKRVDYVELRLENGSQLAVLIKDKTPLTGYRGNIIVLDEHITTLEEISYKCLMMGSHLIHQPIMPSGIFLLEE